MQQQLPLKPQAEQQATFQIQLPQHPVQLQAVGITNNSQHPVIVTTSSGTTAFTVDTTAWGNGYPDLNASIFTQQLERLHSVQLHQQQLSAPSPPAPAAQPVYQNTDMNLSHVTFTTPSTSVEGNYDNRTFAQLQNVNIAALVNPTSGTSADVQKLCG